MNIRLPFADIATIEGIGRRYILDHHRTKGHNISHHKIYHRCNYI